MSIILRRVILSAGFCVAAGGVALAQTSTAMAGSMSTHTMSAGMSDSMKPAATDTMKPAGDSMSSNAMKTGAMSAPPAHTASGDSMNHNSNGM
jgi:hypothetical protein